MEHAYGDEAADAAGSVPSDAELLAAVRAGDQAAYGELWTRHAAAARSLAQRVARPSDVDELVSESFYRVLRAIDGGGGPDGAFRPYLLSTLRRATIDIGRSYYQRIRLTEDHNDLDVAQAPSAADTTLEQDEQSAAWRAWASLPESSRTLLWHLIIEEETPTQIAPLLGTSPNGVSSRAVRARERLRQAFLQQHIITADSQQCAWTRERLGEYVRNALSRNDSALVEQHLDECERCAAAAAEVRDLNMTLRVVILPIVLGGSLVATRYLATRHAAATAAGASAQHMGRPMWVKAGTAFAAAAAVSAVVIAVAGYPGNSHNSPAAELQGLPSSSAVSSTSAPTSASASSAVTTPARRSSREVTPQQSIPLPVLLPSRATTHAPVPDAHGIRPSHTATPTPTRSTPTPTPTPSTSTPSTSTPSTSTPSTPPTSTPSTTPTPTPSPSTTAPSTPTTTPTPTPTTTAPSTANREVTRTVTGLDGSDATLDISVSSGWTITSVAAPSDSTCTISADATAVECAITDPGPDTHSYVLELLGPTDGSGVMHVSVVSESGIHLVADFPF